MFGFWNHHDPKFTITLSLSHLQSFASLFSQMSGVRSSKIFTQSQTIKCLPPGEPVNLGNWVEGLLGVVHCSSYTPGLVCQKINKKTIKINNNFDWSVCEIINLLHPHCSSSSPSPSSSTSSSSSSSPITLEREHLNPLNPPFLVLICKIVKSINNKYHDTDHTVDVLDLGRLREKGWWLRKFAVSTRLSTSAQQLFLYF